MSRLVMSKDITTTIEMLNHTVLGRAKGLERGLDYALREVPDADFVTIRVYKWIDDEPPEPWSKEAPPEPPPLQVVEEAIVGLEGGKA